MSPSIPGCKLVAAILTVSMLITANLRGATAAQVDSALAKAVKYLYSQQRHGNWELIAAPENPGGHDSVRGGQWGGLTGIATFALLAAEQDPQDPRIGKAVDFLQNAKMDGVYAISMRAQVWPFMSHVRKVHEFAETDAELLMKGAQTKGPGRGQWYYYVNQPKDLRTDHSASQFALLGMWACEEAGVEIPSGFWKTEDAIWRRDQMPSGGWAYVYQAGDDWGKPYLTMTCAGLASLYITQEKQVTVASRCVPLPADAVIDRGIDYVAQHYPTDFGNAPPDSWVPAGGKRQMYLLFGLSRLGLASGLRYFGTNDWFKTGSDYLVKSQLGDGSFGDTWETAFGVLFLARGRAPVAFNKLQYEMVGNPPLQTWNVRPRDMANLADWMGKSLERRINWQIVDIKTNPDDWVDAPILYISGTDEIKVSADETQKLKRFIESGGLIVGNADCASVKFTTSFKKLGKELFPSYEFAELPPAHAIFTREQFLRSKWKAKPRVLSISNGVRELMLLCPDTDLGRAYATQDDRTKSEAYQFGVDLYEYMAGLDLRRRGDTLLVTADPGIKATRTARVAMLKYNGNYNPEPGGWRRMAGILHNQDKLDLSVEPVEITGKLDGFALAHLTGTTNVKLDAAQRAALLAYVNAGGTLLVDSAGSNADFTASMEQQLNAIFGQTLTTLPPDAPLYRQGDAPLATFKYSRFARSTLGSLRSPRLRAISVNGRVAVIYSAEDLSMGMVGQPVDGIVGYSPETTTEIIRRIVLMTAPGK